MLTGTRPVHTGMDACFGTPDVLGPDAIPKLESVWSLSFRRLCFRRGRLLIHMVLLLSCDRFPPTHRVYPVRLVIAGVLRARWSCAYKINTGNLRPTRPVYTVA